MLVVNPGEACGYVTGRCTVSLLDTERRAAWLIDLG
jgi:predicted phosphodiesterase